MMRPLKIAQVTNLYESVPPLHQHGLEQVVYDLTEELVKMGHEVTLFATGDSKTSAKLVPIWPTALCRDPLSNRLDQTTYSAWSVSEAFIRQREFDIIHDHTRFMACYFAGCISTPVVSTVHHPVSFEQKLIQNYPRWEKHVSHLSTVVVSQFQARQYPGKCQTIYNGIPLDNWQFSPNGGDYLAFLGYITPDKGVAEAIQAVLPTNKKLYIAGPLDNLPVNQNYFKEKVAPFIDNKKIKYLGPLNFSEKMKFLCQAQALLVPIQWDEPFGLVAIEALACGTPVIALNRAAMPEIIDKTCGFLCDSITEMTNNINNIESIDRKNCRKRVEENFSSKIMADNYVKLYEDLCLLPK